MSLLQARPQRAQKLTLPCLLLNLWRIDPLPARLLLDHAKHGIPVCVLVILRLEIRDQLVHQQLRGIDL
ncbi:MAG TPA: hypothetical protein VNU28_01275, partial [Solirubrobacteraceae bacterium]|nr:hypothetical protein [Solirubrobacteraceae bacterium]